jgi:hypothetical protein
MKKIVSLVFALFLSLQFLGQSSDPTRFVGAMQSANNDSLVALGKTFFESGRTTAALLLLEKGTSADAQELKSNINHFIAGEPYSISSEFTEYTENYSKIVERARSNKNKKVKKSILDSLSILQPENTFEKIACMNACVDLAVSVFNKKVAQQSIEKLKLDLDKELTLVSKHFMLDQLLKASTKIKNTKLISDLSVSKENIEKEIENVDAQFQKELILLSSTKKETPKIEAPKPEVPKSNPNWILFIASFVVIGILLGLLLLLNSSKNKKYKALESTISNLKERSEHDNSVQNQSIRHHEIQLSEARKRIESLESKNGSLIKQYSENFELLDQQVAEYQSDLKAAIDRVTREGSVQNMMELNNVLTRNGQKIRENIKSLRI